MEDNTVSLYLDGLEAFNTRRWFYAERLLRLAAKRFRAEGRELDAIAAENAAQDAHNRVVRY